MTSRFEGGSVTVLAHVDSSSLYKTGHMANRWFRVLMEQLEFAVSTAAPKRTGEMAAGITQQVTAFLLAERMDGLLKSDADYSLFVLRGTTGPIMATNLFRAGGDPSAAFVMLWGWENPRTGKFSTKPIPSDMKARGVRRKQMPVGKKGFFMGVRPAPHSFY